MLKKKIKKIKKIRKTKIPFGCRRGYVTASADDALMQRLDLDKFIVTPVSNPYVLGKASSYSIIKYDEKKNLLYLPYYMSKKIVKEVVDVRAKRQKKNIHWKGEYREGQKEAVMETLELIKRKGGSFLNADAGSGKTVMGLAITSLVNSWPVVITVDSRKLLFQWAQQINKFFPTVKFSFVCPIATQRWILKKLNKPLLPTKQMKVVDTTGDFIITSVQTLMGKEDKIKAGLIICDEVHVMSAEKFSSVIYNIQYRYSLGLSATNKRKDKAEWVFKAFLSGENIVKASPPTAELDVKLYKMNLRFKKGWEKKFEYFFCGVNKKMEYAAMCARCDTRRLIKKADGTEECKYAHELNYSQAKKAFNMMALAMVCTDQWQEEAIICIINQYKNNRHMFVFSFMIEPLLDIRKRLIDVNVPEEDIGNFFGTPKNNTEREEEEASLTKKITLTTYAKCQKAVDAGWKDTLIAVTPPSVSELNQLDGRIKRLKEDGGRALAIFLCDTTNPTFKNKYYNIKKHYRRLGCPIKEVNVGKKERKR